MGRRRKQLPDNRLDWRDPDMPVLRKNKVGKDIEVSADWIREYYEIKIEGPFYNAPNWKDDPTYDLRKKK